MTLALTAEELAQVHGILAAHLPAGVRVGVFGSRAGGTPKPYSDLVLEGEAALPWKVDLLDRRAVTDAFGASIDAGRVQLI